MSFPFTVPRNRVFRGKRKTVSVRLPKQLREQLEAIAEEADRGFSDVLHDALDEYAASPVKLDPAEYQLGKNETVAFRIPIKLHTELKTIGKEKGRTFSDEVQAVVQEFVSVCRAAKGSKKAI